MIDPNAGLPPAVVRMKARAARQRELERAVWEAELLRDHQRQMMEIQAAMYDAMDHDELVQIGAKANTESWLQRILAKVRDA